MDHHTHRLRSSSAPAARTTPAAAIVMPHMYHMAFTENPVMDAIEAQGAKCELKCYHMMNGVVATLRRSSLPRAPYIPPRGINLIRCL